MFLVKHSLPDSIFLLLASACDIWSDYF